ncbi:hypothetical protein [Devosia faecipullorum]|uniref:hypothetical protein n=1 Tax=Devosia faecipullorum TaxID=2755039 RepID=UPI00187BA8A8|nr:hypothetical protein [Devosia faecipullorum]MBE7733427.1 hypothetical protein [Devosia faecipullorum]
MIKNSVIALVSAAALAGIAMPAMAVPPPAPVPGSADSGPASSFDADYVQYQLQAKGVNAISVEPWGSYVRAYVSGADGRVTMQFFHEDTLAPANL